MKHLKIIRRLFQATIPGGTSRLFFTAVSISVSIIVSTAVALSFSSCTNDSPKLVLPEHTVPVVVKKPTVENGVVVLGERPPVDILFVIDDSSSMYAYQSNLAANISSFVQAFLTGSVTDYHIGVISSSTDNPGYWSSGNGRLIGYPSFVDRSTPNAPSVLQRQMMIGTAGSGTERFFDPVQLAFSEPNLSGYNRGFYRPDAYLAIVFITDAEDHSVISTSDFTAFIRQLKPGHPEKILNYAALIPSGVYLPTGCNRDDAGIAPLRIEEYLHSLKGLEFNLCADDFGKKLTAIGADLSLKVGSAPVVLLKRKPVESSIQVTYGSQVIPRDAQYGWAYDPGRIALIFGDKISWSNQPYGTQVQVEFIPADVAPPQP